MTWLIDCTKSSETCAHTPQKRAEESVQEEREQKRWPREVESRAGLSRGQRPGGAQREAISHIYNFLAQRLNTGAIERRPGYVVLSRVPYINPF